MKPKFITVVGTRPELIRLSRLFPLLDQFFDHRILHTGQNSDPNLSDVFFSDLGIRTPDVYLETRTSNLGSAIGSIFEGVGSYFEKFKPEGMLVLGDTNSGLAALLARRMQIVTYHWEAGNRSFDGNVPEEINRRVIDHGVDFNIAYSEAARANLLQEGLHPRRTFVSGSPLKQVLDFYREKSSNTEVLQSLDLEPGKYFLASFHRQENVDLKSNLSSILEALCEIREEFKMPVVVSTHPRTVKRIEEFGLKMDVPGITFARPFGYHHYMHLQRESFCVISDSGSVSEEASIEGFPAVTIRSSMERPEALERASIVMSSFDPKDLIESVNLARLNIGHGTIPVDYDVDNAAERVLGIIWSTLKNSHSWDGIRSLDI